MTAINAYRIAGVARFSPSRLTIQARVLAVAIPMWVATNSAESRAIVNVGCI